MIERQTRWYGVLWAQDDRVRKVLFDDQNMARLYRLSLEALGVEAELAPITAADARTAIHALTA